MSSKVAELPFMAARTLECHTSPGGHESMKRIIIEKHTTVLPERLLINKVVKQQHP